ncbi:MAG: DUF1062 domain-containing protein [Clostridiales bacterium]|nr:DUF1062 domain-containing protein [Clostridiales bacterium]
MSNTEYITWKVNPLDTPAVLRNCNKCGGKQEYKSSGLFRVNAQGRNLDIWLIYRCTCCGNSWNMEIHARVKPQSIPAAEYDAYLRNDAQLAEKCAFDKALLRRNNALPCYDGLRFAVIGAIPQGDAEITIEGDFDLDIHLSKILRQKLGLSGAAFRELLARKQIVGENGMDLQKARWKNGTKISLRFDNTL